MVGDLAHSLISQALGLDNTEEEEDGEEEGMMTMSQPSTKTSSTASTASVTTVAAPLLTDVEIEMWWSSLTTLGHLLTDCLPAKVIVDTSLGLKVFIQLLLPLTRSLSHHGNGNVLRKSGRVVEQGVAGATTTATTNSSNSNTSNSSTSNFSSSNSSSSMTQPYSNLPLETVPSRPTIISTLLLGTTTTTNTTTTTSYLYCHNVNTLSIVHPPSLTLFPFPSSFLLRIVRMWW